MSLVILWLRKQQSVNGRHKDFQQMTSPQKMPVLLLKVRDGL